MAAMNMNMMEQPPILSRVNRLDNVVRHLEEMRGSSWRRSYGGGGSSTTASPTSTTNSDGGCSSSSPRSLQQEKKSSCRPMDDVVSETEHKGTLLHRLSLLEDRVLQLCLQLEKEMVQHNDDDDNNRSEQKQHTSTPTMKSFKRFVKSCVKSKSKSKSKNK